MKLELLNETFELLPEKALFWPGKKTLIFSDVHLGKAESFQAVGVPVPSGINTEDLERIAMLIVQLEVRDVLILGDLIHNKNSWSEELFLTLQDFFSYFKSVKFKLLIGNHERGSMEYLKELPLELIEGDYELSSFIFTHGHHIESEKVNTTKIQKMTIEGHVHPVVILKEGPVRMRLPCFVLEKNRLILPSFGSFTGGFELSTKKDTRIFAVTKKIIEL